MTNKNRNLHLEEIYSKIRELKKKRNALILAHNYQVPEIQDIADIVGDSLGLSIEAQKTGCDVIVFCGVYFMAETAKILSPEKTVLMPDSGAGCPLANMIRPDDLVGMKREHPGAKVICYVNSSAEIKALSDYCCTSANALRMVEKIDHDEFIFVPDRCLGAYVREKTGKTIHLWKGFCPVHMKFITEHVDAMRAKYPGAKVMVHPECAQDVVHAADYAFGTEGMLKHAKTAAGEDEYIIGTEAGFVHRLEKEVPGKKFHILSESGVCPNMKKTTVEKLLWCLEEMQTVIEVPHDVAAGARRAIDRMLEIR